MKAVELSIKLVIRISLVIWQPMKLLTVRISAIFPTKLTKKFILLDLKKTFSTKVFKNKNNMTGLMNRESGPYNTKCISPTLFSLSIKGHFHRCLPTSQPYRPFLPDWRKTVEQQEFGRGFGGLLLKLMSSDLWNN